MILIIDNYDSFTYNIYQYVSEINTDIKVFRNDEISIPEIAKLKPSHIIISPGPGTPEKAGRSIDIIKSYSNSYPILGICLGHQAIAVAYGASLAAAPVIVHGKPVKIVREESKIFDSLPNRFMAARYHSLVVSKDNFPKELTITAKTEDGLIMALEHEILPLYGVQFHPESIATEYGKTMIRNFIEK
jgi:anthranilate synthase component 2